MFQKQAFLQGYMSKVAADEGPLSTIGGAALAPASWALNKAMWTAALAPALGGVAAGALASKFTSPASEKDVVQKSLIAAELEEAVAELKRKQAIELKKHEMEHPHERSLHI